MKPLLLLPLLPLLLAPTLSAQAGAELYANADPCTGSGTVPARFCQGHNTGAYTNAILNPTTGRLLIQVTAGAAFTLTGFEVPLVFANRPAEAMVRTYVHLGDAVRGPAPDPVRQGLMHLPTWTQTTMPSPPWQRSRIAPLPVKKGQALFLGFEHRGNQSMLWPSATNPAAPRLPFWTTTPGSKVYTNPYAWAFPIRLLCDQKRGPARGLLHPLSLPRLGRRFDLEIAFAAPNPGVLALGLEPYPPRIPFIPGTTCPVVALPDVLLPFARPASGPVRIHLVVPNLPALQGGRAFLQAFLIDPPSNPTGIVATNGVEAVMGR